MDIWNEEIDHEEEVTLEFGKEKIQVKKYQTVEGNEGYRISLDIEHPIIKKFKEHISDIKQSDSEKKINLIKFGSILEKEENKLINIFPIAGFYVMNNHIVFHKEPEVEEPLIRLRKFLEYYRKKWNFPELEVNNVEIDLSNIALI